MVRVGAERPSDRSLGDRPATRLVGAAEERVGSAAEAQAELLRVGDELPRLCPVAANGFSV